MLALTAGVVLAGPAQDARADDYPGQQEIDAARAVASDQESSVAQLDSAIASLSATAVTGLPARTGASSSVTKLWGRSSCHLTVQQTHRFTITHEQFQHLFMGISIGTT